MMRQRRPVTPNKAFSETTETGRETWSARYLIEKFADRLRRVYFREQVPETLDALSKIAADIRPERIIEIGVGYGLSLRVWLRSGAKIVAVDSDLSHFRQGLEIDPADVTPITIVDTDLEKLLPDTLWYEGERLLVVVNSHLLSPAEKREVWTRLLPALPIGSHVVVTSIWLSPHSLDAASIYPFFANFVVHDIDPTYCFDADYVPHWQGGTIVGDGDLRPFADWLGRARIELNAPGGRNFLMFEVSAQASAPREPYDAPMQQYRYNPAACWRWRRGEFIDPSAQRIIDLCQSGEQAYRDNDMTSALERFSQALLFYERITWFANELSTKMLEADELGNRAEARRYYMELRSAIEKIGSLEGVKRILVCCALREGDLEGALEIPKLSRADFVEPSILDAIRIQHIRTGGASHRTGSKEAKVALQ